MDYPKSMMEAIFLNRKNRFVAELEVGKKRVEAHLANPGRMHELLVPGVHAMLKPATNPERKTRFDFTLIKFNNRWVSLDSQLANDLFDEGVQKGMLAPFVGHTNLKREVTVGRSRLDFLLTYENKRCFVEVKSCTLVEDGLAMFPDAPTIRGVKHLEELIEIRSKGDRAAAVFVIQRDDAEKFTPHTKMDPRFAEALSRAHRFKVEIYAYRCRVTPRRIHIVEPVPVYIP